MAKDEASAYEAGPTRRWLKVKQKDWTLEEDSQIHPDAPGLCPSCLERYIDGREGGRKTDLVEEVVDGVKTGKWICPFGGRTWYQQGARPFIPPIF